MPPSPSPEGSSLSSTSNSRSRPPIGPDHGRFRKYRRQAETASRPIGRLSLTLLCINPEADPAVETVDLSRYDPDWARHFEGVDTVIHLAGDPSPRSPWSSIQPNNVDLTLNVFQAARLHRCRSRHLRQLQLGHGGLPVRERAPDDRTSALADQPLRPGQAFRRAARPKLRANAMVRAASRSGSGWCQKDHDNRPGPHMSMGRWGQQMWLSDRDLCQGMERAILAEGIGFAALNLMSDNPGMRWDIEETRRVIGYDPKDGHIARHDGGVGRAGRAGALGAGGRRAARSSGPAAALVGRHVGSRGGVHGPRREAQQPRRVAHVECRRRGALLGRYRRACDLPLYGRDRCGRPVANARPSWIRSRSGVAAVSSSHCAAGWRHSIPYPAPSKR